MLLLCFVVFYALKKCWYITKNKFLWILRSCDCASWQILIIKPTRCTNFSNLFRNETLNVLDSSFVHHQEFFILHTAMVYVIQVCWQLSCRVRIELHSILMLLASCQQTCMTYTIAVCRVKNSWWWTKELSKTFRVLFQNKFDKLVHLVGFIIKKKFPWLFMILYICITSILWVLGNK